VGSYNWVAGLAGEPKCLTIFKHVVPNRIKILIRFEPFWDVVSSFKTILRIIAKPLHDITKKGAKGPSPWIKGTSYDLAFERLKVLIFLDGRLCLHHKDKSKRLFLEVDAMMSDEVRVHIRRKNLGGAN
jgi:hypothetical protein